MYSCYDPIGDAPIGKKLQTDSGSGSSSSDEERNEALDEGGGDGAGYDDGGITSGLGEHEGGRCSRRGRRR